MRALLCSVILLAACGPKVQTSGGTLDEDLPRAKAAPAAVALDAPRPVAKPGKGARTGTIDRAHLLAVLDEGPGAFLRQLEVTPCLANSRFCGWQLVQVLDHASPLAALDLAPGDVLLSLNGNPLSRPDELQTVWDSLRTANALTAKIARADAGFELSFAIEPAAAAPASAPR